MTSLLRDHIILIETFSAGTDFEKKFIRYSSLGDDDVINTWSCYFKKYLYLQLRIGYGYEILITGTLVVEEYIGYSY